MIRDIATVVWKELKELMWPGGTLRSGRLSLVVLLVVFGIFLPYQSGRDWVETPSTLFYWAWLPLMLVAGAVADSFAGERERHTLETLLASRLPDRAVLIGKLAASVGYGWGLVMVMLALSLITVNLSAGAGGPILFSWHLVVASPVLAMLGAALAGSVGVLVSLRAPTVRQAAQTLNVAIMLLIFVPVFGIQALPETWRIGMLKWVTKVGVFGLSAAIGGILLALDVVFVAAALMRFRRSRLILD